MSEEKKEAYEAPKLNVLGTVADLTQAAKPGYYFDTGSGKQGTKVKPPPIPGVTVS